MMEFELPLVSPRTPLDEVFRRMVERDVSGVVVGHGAELRLVHHDDLRRALERKKRVAGDVESFAPLLKAIGAEPATLQKRFDESAYRYLILRKEGSNATIVSSHETGARPYLSPPTVLHCTNPGRIHFYPPLERSPGETRCRLDDTPLV